MRVLLFAQDDSAAGLLAPLVGDGRKVLGVSAGSSPCPAFAKRCQELGCDCVSSSDPELAKVVVEKFKPDAAFCSPGRSADPIFETACLPSDAKRYLVRFGFGERSSDGHDKSTGGTRPREELAPAPWPEFLPIWKDLKASRVSLAILENGVAGAEVSAAEVPLMIGETALCLRAKHIEAAAKLLHSAVRGELAQPLSPLPAKDLESCVPAMMSLDWDVDAIDRFIRAHSMPPQKPAEVADPNTGEKYLIESMFQFQAFQSKVQQGSSEDKSKQYAADTHWYSNVGGSIVKLTDQNQHMPRLSSEGPMKMAIPGAMAGGARKKLRLNEPLIGPNAERYCSSAIASSWIGVEGPFVKRFEQHLASICGCLAACAVQSGTAALYGAMKALGVSEPSHHVLCPAFTCAAAADAVVHAGGTPIAIDCELDTYGISAEAVRVALEGNPNVVGVVAAHCYGVPIRDMHEVQELCRGKGIWLCEDACESYGASVHVAAPEDGGNAAPPSRPIASFGTLNVISVRSEKMIGVGEGGAIVGNDTTLVARAKWWCSRAPCRGGGLWRVYEHEGVGQNFRMSEMLACVGCAAAEMFPEAIARKRRIHGWYEKYIEVPALKEVKLQSVHKGDGPVWWVNAALMPEGISGEEVGMQLMKDKPDIEIRPGFFPLDQMAIFKHAKVLPCPNTDLLFRRLVCLPSSVQLEEADVARICTGLSEALSIVSQRSAGKGP